MEDEEATAFSELLSPAFQSLIDELLATQGGGMSVSFVAQVNYMNNEGEQRWAMIAQDGQTVTVTQGLVTVLSKLVDRQLDDAIFGSIDDGNY